jgi:hypothetical protein
MRAHLSLRRARGGVDSSSSVGTTVLGAHHGGAGGPAAGIGVPRIALVSDRRISPLGLAGPPADATRFVLVRTLRLS